MLSKEQFIDAICNRFWLYKNISIDTPYGTLSKALPLEYGPREGYAYLGMKFMADGEITFPVKIGFIPPDFYRWDFDEDQQELIIYHRYKDSVKKGKLVENGFCDTHVIKLTPFYDSQSQGILINFPSYDASKITTRTIGGNNMVFIPREFFNSWITANFTRRGYNVSPVTQNDNLFSFVSEIYRYLIEHPKLADVIIVRTGIENMAIKFPQNLDQLLVAKDNNQPSLDYCAGSRAIILELLIMLITANNNRLLDPDDRRSETELVTHILTNHFINRYDLLA